VNLSSIHLTLAPLLITVVASVFLAELAGYGLHRLMHSGRIPVLSRAHLIHHLLLYGPRQSMRTLKYKDATLDRTSIGNVGMEWILPSVLILGFCWSVMWLLGVSLPYLCLSFLTLVGWSTFMFSYLHDRMHLQGFWMERTPLLGWWFRRARRFHDIHHRSIDENGRMDKNFGIGFYFCDRIFQTLAKHHCVFNWHGYREAIRKARLEEELTHGYSPFPSECRFPIAEASWKTERRSMNSQEARCENGESTKHKQSIQRTGTTRRLR
jgi:sterol desaturase/sphingolipid hydroxylase (fatty acid hydroxylase superfamily)